VKIRCRASHSRRGAYRHDVLPSVVLVHGAATTGTVWQRLLPHLQGLDVQVPDRPCTGDLETEIAYLRAISTDAVVVGVGGGATLGLALLGAGVPLAAAVLHEPAAGSLVPGLLDPMVRAYAEGGVAAFAAALYGAAWLPSMAPADAGAVARDLAMFRDFEPQPVGSAVHVLTTVGELSPPVRREVGEVLRDRFGLPCRPLPGCGHAVHLERPDVLAACIRGVLEAF
jgi:pimeloyl-ACP methyl ester carboxylesterase